MATPAVAAERPSSSLSPCLFRFAHTVLSASARQPGCSAAPARSVLSPVAGLTTWRRSAVDWVKVVRLVGLRHLLAAARCFDWTAVRLISWFLAGLSCCCVCLSCVAEAPCFSVPCCSGLVCAVLLRLLVSQVPCCSGPVCAVLLRLIASQGDINVEWCNKTGAMKYLFKYVTKGPDFSELYLQTPPSVMKPPEPSDGKSEIGSEVKRALFTEMSPKQPEEELAPEILSKELGLPASDAPDSPPASSAGPSVDNSSAKCKQPQTQPDGAGKKKKT